MLLLVEHQPNQPLPKAEGCDEVNEISQYPGRRGSGVTMLQVSVPRHRVRDWPRQSFLINKSSFLATSSAEAL